MLIGYDKQNCSANKPIKEIAEAMNGLDFVVSGIVKKIGILEEALATVRSIQETAEPRDRLTYKAPLADDIQQQVHNLNMIELRVANIISTLEL